ncbi:hypothetical protein [Pseudarthrobacter sp. TAF60_1]|uniref:hypothetical protein n=1 Tax=Pseudarthrobacter sp. TAF60_1 TaxID=3233071 RepID=UPI003F9E36CD
MKRNPYPEPGIGRQPPIDQSPATDHPSEEPPSGVNRVQQQPPPPPGSSGKAVASLVLAIFSPLTLVITAPFARFAMLLTFPYDGPSRYPWAAPLALWSLPLIFGLISIALALAALRKSERRSETRGLAVASLWICGVIFVIGLILTLRFVYLMHLG